MVVPNHAKARSESARTMNLGLHHSVG
jgi:predicted transcriptional regulator